MPFAVLWSFISLWFFNADCESPPFLIFPVVSCPAATANERSCTASLRSIDRNLEARLLVLRWQFFQMDSGQNNPKAISYGSMDSRSLVQIYLWMGIHPRTLDVKNCPFRFLQFSFEDDETSYPYFRSHRLNPNDNNYSRRNFYMALA